jgi:hypothetical protein
VFKRLGLLITTASLLSGSALLAIAAPAGAATQASATGGTPQQNYVSGLYGDYLTYSTTTPAGLDFATSANAAVLATARQNDGSASLSFYTGQLGLATTSTPPSGMNTVSTEIINSSEFRNDLVSQDYVCYLGRVGDATGVAYYDALKGVTINTLAESLLSSSEFFNSTSTTSSFPGAMGTAYYGVGSQCGTVLSATSGPAVPTVGPNGNFDSWLTDVYGVLLNRAVDSSSKTYWDAQYVKGVSLASIVTAILNSTEYENDQVTNFYTHFLRPSSTYPLDTSGVAYYVGLMKNGAGATPEQVMAQITSSSQYWTWTQSTANV